MSMFILNFLNSATAILHVNPTTMKTFRFVGATKPHGYFDPLKITINKSENKVKFIREAELQHGRAAMAATLAIPLLEKLDADDSMIGINYLSSLDFNQQAPFLLGVFLYEYARMNKGWVNPFTKDGKIFTLKESYQPGNLGNLSMSSVSDDLLNKELNNGRLAMIGFMGMLAQELVSGQPIF